MTCENWSQIFKATLFSQKQIKKKYWTVQIKGQTACCAFSPICDLHCPQKEMCVDAYWLTRSLARYKMRKTKIKPFARDFSQDNFMLTLSSVSRS